MKTITAWFVLLLGGIMILPLIGINQLGTATTGILGWTVDLILLFLGVYHLSINYK